MPDQLSEDLVAAFDALFGGDPTVRAAHAKGTCCDATFEATPDAGRITRAPHMQGSPVRTTVRFSNGSGALNASDGGREPRGMAVKFHLDGKKSTDIVSINHHVFIVRTPEEVVEFMRLRVPDPTTGQLDFAALAAFVGARPESQRAAQLILGAPPLDSFLRMEYFAIHAFRFIAADGTVRFGKYHWRPALGVSTITPEEAAVRSPDYLREDLLARLASEPAVFELHLKIGAEGDDPDDPTSEWPDDREEVHLGRLTVTGPGADQEAGCETLVFDPTRLCDGIEATDDKILLARPGAYVVSSKRRIKARR